RAKRSPKARWPKSAPILKLSKPISARLWSPLVDACLLVRKPVPTFRGDPLMPLIELKHVVGGYGGAPILNGVNMAIEKEDIGVIVGPNGAGKSTTLKAIFGLLKVTGGTIEFGG